ncbi:MAG TPA: RNA methyltransferase [Armatimonadetes bacterium]|nr:RNA methyltransferase [Armatimonadota bacterium]
MLLFSLPTVGLKHPAVQAARALHSPAARSDQGRYLIEGENLLAVALASEVVMTTAFFAQGAEEQWADLALALQAREVPCYRVSRGVLRKILGTGYETAVASAAVVERLAFVEEALFAQPEPLLVVGERLQDPLNVGVLVCTADAVGATALMFTTDGADPFSRRAVRSSTGSILRLPVGFTADLPGKLRNWQDRGVRVIATSAHADTDYWEVDFTGPCAVVVGNETTGLSPAVRDLAQVTVRIPMRGGAHSLNVAVAAGIVLYERVRQQASKGRPGGE